MGGFLTGSWPVTRLDRGKARATGGVNLPALPALESWYDASILPLGAITTWANRSGVGSALAGTATVVAAQLNGLKGAVFNGTTDAMIGTLSTPGTARTVSMVVSSAATNNAQRASNFGGIAGVSLARLGAGSWVFTPSATVILAAPGVVQPGVMSWVITASTVDVYYNGLKVASGTPAGTPLDPAFALGASTVPGNFKACTWFEHRTWATALTPSDILIDATSLRSKWGI